MRARGERGTGKRSGAVAVAAAAVVVGSLVGPGVVGAVPAPLRAAAPAPGATVAIPAPGSATASPATAVTITGAPAAAIGPISATGSRSGPHRGATAALPDGRGVAFTPTSPFAPGETVTVTSGATVSGASSSSYTFTVGTPAPHPGPQLFADEQGAPGVATNGTRSAAAPTYASRPDLRPPGVTIGQAASGTAPGYLMATPSAGADSAAGVMIYDDAGEPVWFKPEPDVDLAGNLQVDTVGGQPSLVWFEGDAPYGPGSYRGSWIVADRSYREVARIDAGNGYQADVHDIRFTDHDSAYVMAYNPLLCSGVAPLVGCTPGSTVLEAVLQEVDLSTRQVLWEWHSLDHVPLSDAYQPIDGQLVDYFHSNSIDLDDDGDVLLSSRITSSLYKIDRTSGNIEWRFGGKHSSFPNLVGEPNAITGPDFPHDFSARGSGSYSYFDNGVRRNGPSRAAVVTLDPATGTATYTKKLIRTPALFGPTQGSMQGLPGGHELVAWGGLGTITEYDAAGAVRLDATLTGVGTYRQFRFPWTGAPAERPVAATRPSGVVTAVAMSWNGDTRATQWRILAGASPGTLAPVATVARTGFETTATITGRPAYVAVEALDATASLLGRSTTARATTAFTEAAAPPVTETYRPLVGDFGGSRNDDVLYYRPGSGGDFLHVADGQGGFSSLALPAISGTYTPLVGDFVGDDRDEVLFWQPGQPTAYLWRFDLGARTGAPVIATGAVTVPTVVTKPVVLDQRLNYGGRYDEVLWYAAGTAPDRVDRFTWAAGGGPQRTSRSVTINGTYQPVSGDFDGDGLGDVFFYGPGSAGDALWLTVGGPVGTTGQRSLPVTVNGTFSPLVGNFTGTEQRDELLFSAPGPGADFLWSFDASGAHTSSTVTSTDPGTGYVLAGPNDRVLSWTPGAAPSLWTFDPTSTTPSGNGALAAGYQPLIGDFVGAGGTASVLWYAPGAAMERLYIG
ncbi:aryl-sulfate sulfotransferase [Aquihabitans sp. G128]|uniref:arylsulfotransferase family protein n=1 Tax=Aquihabitans sp. G128 TaxID=2849779 RepID=UPI001C23EE8A|nr:arylsulfotransferase family protein [Aquihabitans sp. G128]QXC62137.1 aryl-sulfate sulfotransferase [Aquihabitans sp. G128]